MKRPAKRPAILAISAMLVFVVAIGLVKFFQSRAAIARSSSFAPPPTAVTTTVAGVERWPVTLRAVGSVAAVQGVTVSADLSGIVRTIAFESGAAVREGELLVALDARQERAQRLAAAAERRLAESNLERARPLRDEGVIAQQEYEGLTAESQRTAARVAEIDATLERKRIRAPFSGTLGIRRVNLGQYLDAGDPVVSLETLDPVFVSFSVPQQDLDALRIDAEVRITTQGAILAQATGRVTAIEAVVDESTRNVEVQATFANPLGVLRPGMFVEAQVVLGEGHERVSLPASAISHAPYGDSVFIVEELTGVDGEPYVGLRQEFVELGGTRGDRVAVVSGVGAGDEVVTSGVFRLRAGAPVLVNNEIQPSDDPQPEPENR